MNKDKNLSENQIMAMAVGFMIGIGILALPSALTKDAKQDAWIAAIIGGIYPVIIGLAAVYMCKYFPQDNILVLSKKYLGKILGTVCNFVFMMFFYIYVITGVVGFSNIFRVYATPFLTALKMQVALIIIIIYTQSKGIKVIAKLNELAFYTVCILMTFLSVGFLKGNIKYVEPVFGVGVSNILKSSIESAYAYSGIEQIFLIYPLMEDKKKLKSAVFKAVGITVFFYTWVTFISIYFLGYKVTGKTLWPVFLVSESISISIINSFKSIFLLAWTGIMCKLLGNEYASTVYIAKDVFNIKARWAKWSMHVIAVVIMFYSFTKMPTPMARSEFLGKVIPLITIYIFIYVGSIVIFIFFDKNKKAMKN